MPPPCLAFPIKSSNRSTSTPTPTWSTSTTSRNQISAASVARSIAYVYSYRILSLFYALLTPPPFKEETNSLVNLMEVLAKLERPPTFILIENVYGFERSDAHAFTISRLSQLRYSFQEFHLSPLQFGIPNQRLRYFLVAKLTTNEPIPSPPPSTMLTSIPGVPLSEQVSPISEYLDSTADTEAHYQRHKDPGISGINLLTTLYIYVKIDIKLRDDRNTNCFTRAYFKFVEGTGSILQTADASIKADASDINSLVPLRLRYFSPKEITRLHCFPESFNFPTSCTLLQCYRLIGNSLNVRIVAELLKYLYYRYEEESTGAIAIGEEEEEEETNKVVVDGL
uniref:DNA (Cytosine-5-)-methyltransferase n=1 Tax=Rostrostelium ellipticum TaxID=361140 RepID=A0A1L2FUR4_9MYCE|nr:DNA (cytosine-5-)-methyltransferase [Rostrostelium ellipticum]